MELKVIVTRFLGLKFMFVFTLVGTVASVAHARTCESLFSPKQSSNSARDLIEALAIGPMRPMKIDRAFAASLPLAKRLEQNSKLDRLSSGLQFAGFAGDVKTVLYAASGFDAGTPFRLFPKAETVVAIDNHPFAFSGRERRSVSQLDITNRGDDAWVVAGDVTNVGALAESIVVAIETSALSADEGPVRIRRVLKIPGEGQSGPFKIVHGVVEFDHGEGTELRRYIHICSSKLADRNSLPKWTAALLAHGFQAVLMKAAMSFYANYGQSLGGYLLDELSRRGGLIIDGDGEDAWLEGLQRSRGRSAIEVIETKIGSIGYAANVRVVELTALKPAGSTNVQNRK